MIALKAFAKLNLSLGVLGKRPDGYHELDTVMQSISLHDIVAVEKADYIHVRMIGGSDIRQADNTAFLAADAFCRRTGAGGADITIQKRIPRQAGLGGASADAAAVLNGMNALYDTGLSPQELAGLGLSVGADVPFSLVGGTMRAKGVGERLEPLRLPRPLFFVVVKPRAGVSTAQAFAQYRPGSPVRMNSVIFALQKGDLKLFHSFCANALGMAALSIAPSIMQAAGALTAAGAEKTLMSGSGSAMFAVFETAAQAHAVFGRITGDFELVGMYTCTPAGTARIEAADEPV